MKKIINKFKSQSGQTVVGNLFLLLLLMIVLVLIFKAVELFSIVKNSRDSLERAALNVAAVNEYKLYDNFRENVISNTRLSEFVTESEIIDVLESEMSMEARTDGVYKIKQGNDYYYRLNDINTETIVEDNPNNDMYRINISAVLTIPIGFWGIGDYHFDMSVSCVYASKNNAVE